MSDRVLEAQKQELTTADETERTRDRQCFAPRADIYETQDEIVVLTDFPGVDENSVDVTLEKNVLTINGYVNESQPEDYSLALAEYEVGDYTRSFRLSDEINREGIEAMVKDGVLRLRLPKAGPALARKISVKVG
jgi:HSP20 family molecular chaperone IbpA